MELGGYIGVVRRWWLVLLASTVVAGAGGFLVASQLPRVYEAEVRLLVGPLNTDFETQRAAGQLANTYAQLASSRRITEAVLAQTRADRAVEDLQAAITAVPNDVTRLVIVRVQDSDPALAAELANAVAEELGLLAAESQRPEGQIEVIDPAAATSTQVAPQVLLIALLAAFAGLLAAISIIVLLEYARDGVRSEDELRALADVPILGHLTTRLDRRRDFPSAVLGTPAGDEYLAMTARIDQSLGAKRLRSVLLVGVEPGASTGLVGVGLALAFGDRGVPAAVVDASTGGPSALEVVGVSPIPGLDARIAAGDVPLTALDLAVASDSPERRRSVPLFAVPGSVGGQVVRTDRLQAILDAALRQAQVVIVTTAEPDRTPDALLWAGLLDAVVLVVPMPGARRRRVRESVQALQVARKRFIGAVLTDAATSGRTTFRQPLAPERPEPSGSRIREDRSPRAARDLPGAGSVR